MLHVNNILLLTATQIETIFDLPNGKHRLISDSLLQNKNYQLVIDGEKENNKIVLVATLLVNGTQFNQTTCEFTEPEIKLLSCVTLNKKDIHFDKDINLDDFDELKEPFFIIQWFDWIAAAFQSFWNQSEMKELRLTIQDALISDGGIIDTFYMKGTGWFRLVVEPKGSTLIDKQGNETLLPNGLIRFGYDCLDGYDNGYCHFQYQHNEIERAIADWLEEKATKEKI